MYDIILSLHSFWAYVVLFILFIATINAIVKRTTGKDYMAYDFRISLFALIASHIQLLIGLILYFVSPRFELWSDLGGEVMGNSIARLYLVEHPVINIIAIALITIDYSKHKKKLVSKAKFNTLAIFYTIAFVLFLSRIPWSTWLG